MARAKKASASRSPSIDAAFWEDLGVDESASTREKLLMLTFSEISRRGILDVNARWVCDLLEVDPSAINYHFGAFDGLVAEVFVTAHTLWTASVDRGLSQSADSPEQRLRNVLDAQVERAKKYGSVIGLAHLPHVSEQVEIALMERHPKALSNAIEYVVSVGAILIHDLRSGAMTPIHFGPDNPPTEWAMEAIPQEFAAAARMQWAIVGPTMWMTGAGGGFSEISQAPEPFQAHRIWPGFVDRIVTAAKNDWL